MKYHPANLFEGMDADDLRRVLKLAGKMVWKEGYNIHKKKILLIQEFQRKYLPEQGLSQVAPKHLWMLTQMYAHGKKYGEQDLCEWAAACLLKEGYVLHPFPKKQWGLQRISISK